MVGPALKLQSEQFCVLSPDHCHMCSFFFLQEDIEASLDNLQDVDMMELSVLDEAEIDNSSAIECRAAGSASRGLDSLSGSKGNAGAGRREHPQQLAGCPAGDMEAPPQLPGIKEDPREIPVAMVCVSTQMCRMRSIIIVTFLIFLKIENSMGSV